MGALQQGSFPCDEPAAGTWRALWDCGCNSPTGAEPPCATTCLDSLCIGQPAAQDEGCLDCLATSCESALVVCVNQ